MKTTVEHRAKIKEIADLAFANGVEKFDISGRSFDFSTWKENDLLEFYAKCNDGLKGAQKLLVEEVMHYQQLSKETTAALKAYRVQRLEGEIKNATSKKALIAQRLTVLSHLADAIAWQLLGGKTHLARRLNMGEGGTKILADTNVRHAIEVSDKINENPLDFALISDLTGFIEIGDLLVRHLYSVGVMELKEGNVNDAIAQFFDKLEQEGKTIKEVDLTQSFDGKTVKQIERMQRQKDKIVSAVEIMNTDTGIDPITQKRIYISTPTIGTQYYHEELIALREQLKERIWSYTVIDNCLHIGMYRDEGLGMAQYIIEELLKSETEHYILIDWLSITSALSAPLFFKPFEPEFIFDVLIGKVKVIMGLNVDKLIEAFNIFGLPTRWMTKKETAKYKDAGSGPLIEFKHRGIVSELPNSDPLIISYGILSKIVFDNIKPTNLALSYLTAIRPEVKGE